MANLQKIIKVTRAQYDTLASGGTVGSYTGLNDNYLYLVPKEEGSMTFLTYAQLKTLRNNNQLVPGQQYRITDYQCTTTQTDTSSATHQFDIIVTANSTNQLNEKARAALHSSDTYFANSKLEAWELWYSLDNDTVRFIWADGTNGKGVVYRMIDEFGNDAPYDFKNIMFKRYKITECQVAPDLENKYLGVKIAIYTIDEADFIWCYTFTWINENDGVEDCSIIGQTIPQDNSQYSGVFGNIIKKCSASSFSPNEPESFGLALNDIVVQATYNYSEGTFEGMYGNIFGNNCCHNTIGYGDDCHSNIFGDNCTKNIINGKCYNNFFGNECSHNILGSNCLFNVFGSNCSRNTFNYSCHNNIFSNDCSFNTFGHNSSSNTFGTSCSYNTFGTWCYDNTFSTGCSYNTFGNHSSSNTFGNDCHYACCSIGCSHNTFGNGCNYIEFENLHLQDVNYCRYITIDNGCQYLYISSTITSSDTSYLQNVHVHLGVQGTSSDNRKLIAIPQRDLPYETNVYMDSNGNIEMVTNSGIISAINANY